MEDYEEFLQRQVRRMQAEENEESEPAVSRRPSDIRFYGLAVLPPLRTVLKWFHIATKRVLTLLHTELLYEDQRREMRRLREEAAGLMNKRRGSSRVSHVQNVLNSVQIRAAPTLEEFRGETGAAKSMTHDPASKNQSDETTGSPWSSSSCSAFQRAGENPLTSTACDGHAAVHLRALDGEDSLENSRTTVLFEGIPLVGLKPELNTGCRFDVQSQSQPHKHPHVDVSHQGLSSGYVTIETSDVSSSWIEGPGTGTEGRRSDFGGLVPSSSNLTGDIISHAPVDGEVLEEESTVSGQAQPEDIIEAANPPAEPDPAEGPYRMSLQNLLKKSQEHRRRQRMLRNQAKALKASGAEQVDQHSLSDKENEEFFPGDTRKNDPKRIREKKRDQGKDQLIPSQAPTQRADKGGVEPCGLEDLDPNKSDVSFVYRLSNTPAANSAGRVTENASPALSGQPGIPASLPWPTSAAAPASAKSLYLSRAKKTSPVLPRPCQAAGKKFRSMPTPKFCLSPVRSKKGSGVSGPVRKPLVRNPVCVDDEVRPEPCSQGKSAVSVLARSEADVPVCRSTEQAEQIAQLELNLSSLKVLISDLESTLSKSQAQFDPTEPASQQTLLTESASVGLPAGEARSPCAVTFSEAAQQGAEDYGTLPGNKQREPAHCVTSVVQKMRVPEAFRTIGGSVQPSQRSAVLADASNQPAERRSASGERGIGFESLENSLNGSALNRSYDVDTPSRLWSQAGPNGIQLTPELGGQEGVSRAKRRLLMNTVELEAGQQGGEGRPQSSTPKAAAPRPELQLRQEHEEQVTALMEEQRRQQQELLQSLATRYQFLRSVSFPCPSVGSRLEDMATSLPPSSVSMGLGFSSQPSELSLAELSVLSDSLRVSQSYSGLPVCRRPLVAAAVKGYLTRRLLRTERVAQLIRTIKVTMYFRTQCPSQGRAYLEVLLDTQLFLKDLRPQTPGREYSSRQDRALQDRVLLQLRSARYELHDLFFRLGPADRMQVISWDRELARERELKRKENKEPQTGGRSSISAATRKALERKRAVMLQKKAADRSKQALGPEDGWSFMPNPRRVPKKAAPLRRPR
ncbi:hypothetical protein NFI96_017055 [Prochilodus magdalenae]|nr:hypothetical protein NFI96_017055 [Prochilodus magdalenae]